MSYLDLEKLQAIDTAAFRTRRPYPWVNPAGLLRDEAFATLRANLPDISTFRQAFGHQRKFGQKSHDRYSLKYRPGLAVPAPWLEFVEELNGDAYRGFLSRLLGRRHFDMDFLWYYTPTGCSVSPHCDHKDKLGAHIFYLNTDGDWKQEWGGETLILDSGGTIARRSAPGFEDFRETIVSESMNNRSLLFARTDNSWHGVREIDCPEGELRKIFLVAIKKVSPAERLRRLWRGGLAPATPQPAEVRPTA